MATFKVTVDENSELGLHIGSLSPRGRSREIYMLACIGLLSRSNGLNKQQSVGGLVHTTSESLAMVNPEEKAGVFQDVSLIEQMDIVDFGDDLLRL